jgi:hypothetical protein
MDIVIVKQGHAQCGCKKIADEVSGFEYSGYEDIEDTGSNRPLRDVEKAMLISHREGETLEAVTGQLY